MENIPEELKKYWGRDPEIEDPVQRIGYALSMMGSGAFYKEGTFDYYQKDNQILLNETTAEYIYNDFTPLQISYIPGSRPQLERIVNRLCPADASERDKVLALVDYVYRGTHEENPDPFPGRQLYVLNAREEEVLKLRHCSCECNTRAILCLAQIAGFPARYASSYSFVDPDKDYSPNGGHAMPEIYLEGGWALFDSDHGFFCIKDDESIASLWDIRQDTSLIDRQPNWVYNSFGRSRDAHMNFRETFLSPHSVMAFTNYTVSDSDDYDWTWIYMPFEAENEELEKVKKEKEALRVKLVKEVRG